MSSEAIGIGLIGCGTVGRGVLRLLDECGETYAARLGRPVELRRILVRDPARHADLPDATARQLTTDPRALLDDDRVTIVVEVAGGVEDAHDLVTAALESGRHVVTANKALLAAHGPELFALARERGVSIAFEASCGGGIPILAAVKFGLAANRVDALYGILNGTCNYVLTKMSEDGISYEQALADAQQHGFAEADPTLDVNGADAAQKLAIVATLAFGRLVHVTDVRREGIDRLSTRDIIFGRELGYTVKLMAIGQRDDAGRLALRVQPCLVHDDEPMAQVRDAFNALSVDGHAVGPTMFYGAGAGQMPTASAVVGDILAVASGWYPKAFAEQVMWPDQAPRAELIGGDGVAARHYLRMDVADEPNVLSRITAILGSAGVSISAVLQHEPDDDEEDGVVPLVITTHEAPEGVVRRAATEIGRLDAVREDVACMRIIE